MKSVSFEEFKKLDIRIGEVVKAEVPKWSHWVIKLTVDLGSEVGEKDPSTRGSNKSTTRSGRQAKMLTVFAGVLGFYKPKDLEGKQFPFIVNIEPKKIGPEGDYSEGMMLAASLELGEPVEIAGEKLAEKPILITPEEKVSPGTKIR